MSFACYGRNNLFEGSGDLGARCAITRGAFACLAWIEALAGAIEIEIGIAIGIDAS